MCVCACVRVWEWGWGCGSGWGVFTLLHSGDGISDTAVVTENDVHREVFISVLIFMSMLTLVG